MARDLQLVEFVNQKTMGDDIQCLLEIKEYSLHFCPILKVDKPLLVADGMALVVDLQA